ncbi:hypothetical protein ABTM69_20245, partial [Acinetobacter baumannii]
MHALVSAQVAAGTKLAQVPVYRADPAVLGQAVNLAVDDPATRSAREAQKTAPAGRDTIQMDAARCASAGSISLMHSLTGEPLDDDQGLR